MTVSSKSFINESVLVLDLFDSTGNQHVLAVSPSGKRITA